MVKLKQTLAHLVFLLLSSASFSFQPLTLEEFDTIREISNELRKRCREDSCKVIGLGRSPTAIIANLQLGHGEDYASNMPLSKFDSMDLTDEEIKKLFLHFSSFLNGGELEHKEKIILLDYGRSGKSILAGRFYIKKYFEKIGLRVDVEPFVISWKPASSTVNNGYFLVRDNFQKEGIENPDNYIYLLDNDNPFRKSLEGSGFDAASEFGGYLLSDDRPKEKKSSELYLKLKNLIKDIHRWLSSSDELRKEIRNDDNDDITKHTLKNVFSSLIKRDFFDIISLIDFLKDDYGAKIPFITYSHLKEMVESSPNTFKNEKVNDALKLLIQTAPKYEKPKRRAPAPKNQLYFANQILSVLRKF